MYMYMYINILLLQNLINYQTCIIIKKEYDKNLIIQIQYMDGSTHFK